MNKTITFPFTAFLFGAILLVACGIAVTPNGNAGTSAVAPFHSTEKTIGQSTNANSIPIAAGNCTLLSKDEVGKVLAQAVDEVRDPSKKGTLCVYQTKNLILEIGFLHQFGGFVNSVKYMQSFRDNKVGDGPLDVPGLGDEAFYNGASIYRILLIRKGESVYNVGLRNVTADQSLSSPKNAQAIEKVIAELLLSRLP
jgi:hypothetical protein